MTMTAASAAQHVAIDAPQGSVPALPARTLATVLLANALEFFDYFAFAAFASFIGAAFFPSGQAGLTQLAAFGTFATGFLLRPVGAIVLGGYADRAGRKPALLLSATLVTAGTLGMAFIPAYATIGLTAPLLLVVCRMVQGFAVGGEMGAAGALMVEQCAPHRRGYYCGWLLAGQGLGLFAAGVCGLVLDSMLDRPQLAEWGWRIPFVLSALMIPLQMQLRRALATLEMTPGHQLAPAVVRAESRMVGWKLLGWGVLLIAGGTVPTYVATFNAPFELAGAKPSLREAFVVTAALGTVTLVMSLVGGRLSDVWGHARVIVCGRTLSIMAVLPTYLYAMSSSDGSAFMVGIVIVTAMSCLAAAPTLALLLNTINRRTRAMSLSLIYAVGVSIFGSTAPAVVAAWNAWSGTRTAGAWYIAVAALAAMMAVRAMSAMQKRTS